MEDTMTLSLYPRKLFISVLLREHQVYRGPVSLPHCKIERASRMKRNQLPGCHQVHIFANAPELMVKSLSHGDDAGGEHDKEMLFWASLQQPLRHLSALPE